VASFKGFLCGIAALIVATIVYIPIAAFVILKKYPPPPGTIEVGVNLIGLLTSPVYWLIAIAAFTLGCYSQFPRRRSIA
jgi:hypothetical protein